MAGGVLFLQYIFTHGSFETFLQYPCCTLERAVFVALALSFVQILLRITLWLSADSSEELP